MASEAFETPEEIPDVVMMTTAGTMECSRLTAGTTQRCSDMHAIEKQAVAGIVGAHSLVAVHASLAQSVPYRQKGYEIVLPFERESERARPRPNADDRGQFSVEPALCARRWRGGIGRSTD
jgi:hypothetical protein